MSEFDSISGLPNRDWSLHRLEDFVAHRAGRFALLFIDVDDLKVRNDEFGHAAGDVLIKDVADALINSTRHKTEGEDRKFDELAAGRFGGDEFILILPDVISEEDLMAVRRRIRTTLAKKDISVSIGGRRHLAGETSADLLKAADKLMYEDKKVNKQQALEAELHAAKWHERISYWLGSRLVKHSGIKYR